jgi:hypothetical protein
MKTKTEIAHIRFESQKIDQLKELARFLSVTRKAQIEWTECLRESVNAYLEYNSKYIDDCRQKYYFQEEDSI